jgi:hypothetical protein
MLEDYGLCDKVYSIGLDNKSTHTTVILKLKSTLSTYVGNMFLYQCYAFRSTNLTIKVALEDIKAFLEAFRTTVSFLNSYNLHIRVIAY